MNSTLKHNASGPIRLLQITDCHLGKEFGHQLAGMDTDASLTAVLQEVPTDAVDLLLATGDLADRGTPEAYTRLKGYMAPLPFPVFYLPGNHDDVPVMTSILSQEKELKKTIRVGNWRIILLDSTLPGQVGGYFDPAELAFLEQQLDAEPDTFTLVAFHHPLMPVGCSWLDQQRISNAAAFEDIAVRNPQLKAIVCGHVHQVFQAKVGQADFFATPSTCAQFAPGSNDFRIDDENPGWRMLELFPDGSVRSKVGRTTKSLSVDLKCNGYH